MNADERDVILAIDVGNSRIKFGVFQRAPGDESRHALPVCMASTAVPAHEPVDWKEIVTLVDRAAGGIGAAIVAGANPAGEQRILSTWPDRDWPQPRVLHHAAELPIQTSVDAPDQVGIDRLLNAVAANVLRPGDRAAIVVSAGTATTVDLVTTRGVFAGGAILPGMELGARALHQYTALLPLIDVPGLLQQNVHALGRGTHAAISSGLWYGQIGAVRELVSQLAGSTSPPPLILVTGGNGRGLAQALGAEFRFEPDLALRGLAFVARFDARCAGAKPAGDFQ